jgi:hypothetical protein
VNNEGVLSGSVAIAMFADGIGGSVPFRDFKISQCLTEDIACIGVFHRSNEFPIIDDCSSFSFHNDELALDGVSISVLNFLDFFTNFSKVEVTTELLALILNSGDFLPQVIHVTFPNRKLIHMYCLSDPHDRSIVYFTET